MESTQVALAIQQTSVVLERTNNAQVQLHSATPEVVSQPTYTPHSTYTQSVVMKTDVLPPTLIPPSNTKRHQPHLPSPLPRRG